MKKLLVLRHAKSSWTDPDLADFDRPLNERGLRAAPFMGSVIVKDGLEPELIISSPAERARTTAELVVQGGDLAADVRFEERIYEASPHTLLQIVSDLDDDLETVLLVGHNPGIEDFVKLLTGVYEPMSTAAMAVLAARGPTPSSTRAAVTTSSTSGAARSTRCSPAARASTG